MKIVHNYDGGRSKIEYCDNGIYDNIPVLNSDGVNNDIKPNTKFKYDCCYYNLESNGELTFISTGDASGRLVIPKSITINGKEHPVTVIGEMVRYNIYEFIQPDKRKKPVENNYTLKLGAFFNTKVTECIFPSTLRNFSGNIRYGSSLRKKLSKWFKDADDFEYDSMFDNFEEFCLKKISFSEDGLCELESLGSAVFYNCHLKMDCLRLPEGLRCIGDRAFYSSGTFGNVKFPSTIEIIENSAFQKCKIRSIDFSENGKLQSIGTNAFNECHLEMDYLRLPEGLRYIGNLAFDGQFDKVKLPSTIETINDEAFWYCNIKSMNFPEGLESVGKNFIDLTYFVDKIVFPSTIKIIPELEWNTTNRWEMVSKSLPEIVVNNAKTDVTIDKITSKNCKLEYVDKTGKHEVDKKRIRNFNFRKYHPKDFDSLTSHCVGSVVLTVFFIFVTILFTVIGILIEKGVLE